MEETTERPALLFFAVPDSGRTWLVDYDEIQRIPPTLLQRGDVLVATREGYEGVMALQVKAPLGDAWELVALEVAGAEAQRSVDCDSHGSHLWLGDVVCARVDGGCGHVWNLHDDKRHPGKEYGRRCTVSPPAHRRTMRPSGSV